MSLVSELRRRNVVRVAIVYGVASWVILQLADVFGSLLELPQWTGKLVILLLALGLPVALVMSWAYEITPEGLARTSEVDRDRSVAHVTARRLDRMIMGGLVLAIGVLLVDRYLPRERPEKQATSRPSDRPADAAAQPRSIAVLPFVNMSNDPANEYFSDGMSEEILNTLAQVEGLQVAARTSSFQFKGQAADIADIGHRLRVAAVLEGSVRREGDSVRITAQLVDVANGYRLWSKAFDRSVTDVFAVQTEIADEIADTLRLGAKTTGKASKAAAARTIPTSNPRAYELFLQGRYLWRQRNGPAVTRAVELLEEATRLDPAFAQAHAALASALNVMQNYASVDSAATRQRTWDAAGRALALDPDLAEALAVQATVLGDRGQWRESERRYLRAIELAPNEATPHHWLAILYLCTGKLREFSPEADRAYALDPANAAIVGLPGIARHLEGDFDAAIRDYELAASMGGVFSLVTRVPHALYDAGQSVEALAALRRGFVATGLDPAVADVIHAARLNPELRAKARRAILTTSSEYYAANHRVFALLLIGEYELAVEQARTLPDAVPRDLLYHAWYASTAGLRQTEAFRRFARDVGLVDYWRERGWPDLCRPVGDDFACD